MSGPFSQPIPNPGPALTWNGQQAFRFLWFDGSYEYAPNRTAWFRNLTAFRKQMGTDEQAPPGRSQDDAHFEMAGQSGPHGGKLMFYALRDEGKFVVPPEFLIPLIARNVEGQADLDARGIIHTHWSRVIKGAVGAQFVCLSHWNFKGGYVLDDEQVQGLLDDPNGEASKSLLAEIRRAILATV